MSDRAQTQTIYYKQDEEQVGALTPSHSTLQCLVGPRLPTALLPRVLGGRERNRAPPFPQLTLGGKTCAVINYIHSAVFTVRTENNEIQGARVS